MGCHTLLQGIFPAQELNPCLLHFRQILYHPSRVARVECCPPELHSCSQGGQLCARNPDAASALRVAGHTEGTRRPRAMQAVEDPLPGKKGGLLPSLSGAPPGRGQPLQTCSCPCLGRAPQGCPERHSPPHAAMCFSVLWSRRPYQQRPWASRWQSWGMRVSPGAGPSDPGPTGSHTGSPTDSPRSAPGALGAAARVQALGWGSLLAETLAAAWLGVGVGAAGEQQGFLPQVRVTWTAVAPSQSHPLTHGPGWVSFPLPTPGSPVT